MMHPQAPVLAYYGDDFTGSTDALEFLTNAGIKTVLFIASPSPSQMARYKDIQAVGVAGLTRSLGPEDMEQALLPAFESFKKLGARQVHYKVCSTFDSSPAVGSIGKAIEIGSRVFQAKFVSLLVAAPALGRYCAFGNLFARMGIGSQGEIYRLDRHPSMSKHPVTPSGESDLRLHLSRQTSKKIGLVDILQVEENRLQDGVEKALACGAEIILFDAMFYYQMANIGQLLDSLGAVKPHFSVGSSGVEMALGNYWQQSGKCKPVTTWADPGAAGPLLVVSGSCSPVTSSQIDWALDNGFTSIAIDTGNMLIAGREFDLEIYINQVVDALRMDRNVLVHTAKGMDDPRVSKTKEFLAQTGLNEAEISRKTTLLYGAALGEITRAVLEIRPVKRLLIAGGDTSSIIARELGIEAVEMIAPLAPGAPLCRAFAPGSPADGLEINFKGGQVGTPDYFNRVLHGR